MTLYTWDVKKLTLITLCVYIHCEYYLVNCSVLNEVLQGLYCSQVIHNHLKLAAMMKGLV